jgi:TIR domain
MVNARISKSTLPRAAIKRKSRRTNAQMFTEKLKVLSGPDQKLITNPTLRDALGWDQERYDRIKAQLIDERAIIVGRGQGGLVGLSSAPGMTALKVFVSYSHADEKYKDELLKHLSPLKRMNLISEWHDRKLRPGEEWDATISKNLESADLILLLVSIDFINSKYCYDIELEKALELHAGGKCVVIPVIIRSCLWQHTPFAKLQALPRDGKAVSSWFDTDDAFATVSEGVRVAAEALLSNR